MIHHLHQTNEETEVSNVSGQRLAAVDEDAGKPGPSGTILLAEDNYTNQKLVAAIVEKAGYRITIVEDGKAAVEHYVSAPDNYNLILMDIQMPQLDGIAAARAIRQWEADQAKTTIVSGAVPRRVSIIAVTAGAVNHERSHYSQAGMDDLLLKPVRREVLLTMIDKWLKNERPDGKTA